MLHLRGLKFSDHHWRSGVYPYNIAAINQVRHQGLRFTAPITFLVGENGTGKTTLLESIAVRYPRIGAYTPHLNTLGTNLTLEQVPLGWNAQLQTAPNAAADGFFLRARSLEDLLSALDTDWQPAAHRVASYRERSHGEGLLQVLRQHFLAKGFYLLDEPETALSFRSSLSVVALLHNLAQSGSQVICATHSPVLLSLPGAQILEFGDFGIRDVTLADLELLRDWRSFLQSPESWLHHLLE